MNPRKFASAGLGGCLALLLMAAGPALAQSGSVTGIVTQQGTGQPVEGALVQLEGTDHTATTQLNGRYLILNVPAGSYTLRVQMIGHVDHTRAITVQAGQATTVEVVLEQEAISLQEIVVTGTAGAVTKAKVPFEVATLQTTELPVPATTASSMLQGKVAGVTVVQGSGKPGSPPSILLRGPTSLNADGRSQEPLYIVDGVILGSSMVDIDGLDVESIEVVKGAAAASLYGSRAANGVVQITTKRGRSMSDNQVRYTLRTDYGRSELANAPEALLSERHQYRMRDGQFVTLDGDSCDWVACPSVALAGTNAWDTYAVHEWPNGAHDQAARFFNQGDYLETYASAEGRAGATNFHVSFSNLRQEGILPGQEGYRRTNFRVNVDQVLREGLHMSASAFYSRSKNDEFPETQGNPLFDLTRMPAGVDLFSCEPGTTDDAGNRKTDCSDDWQNMVLQPDPSNTESPNPLYTMLMREYTVERGRFLGSASVRYSPLSWMDIDANVSYDRLDYEETDFYPKGFRTINNSATFNNGNMYRETQLSEQLNASVTASMRFNLTESIRNTTQFRYLYERDDEHFTWTDGYHFLVADVPRFDNLVQDNLEAGSESFPIRADGYFALTNFDILDRYIIDALVRNDGSSLFGEDERRHWYYRVAGAWRLSQEPWFTLPAVDELKLRYSLGTAGNRPNFEAQYETFTIESGRVTPVTLGNRDLKPEYSREQEVGLDAVLFDGRIGVTFTYANAVTKDQILRVPQLAPTGYSAQWQNAGTLESNTFEASLDAQLLQTDNFNWSARLLFDRTRSEITELTVAPFQYGVPGQALGTVFYARAGERMGTFYGVQFATQCSHLPAGVDCSEFEVNDDGFLVWVGNGSLSDNAWGTASPYSIYGKAVNWGAPVAGQCTDRSTGEPTYFCPVGNSMPDYTLSFSSTASYKGLSVYGLIDAVQGFDVYNQPLQWGVFKGWAGLFDQSGVPEPQRKPIGYFSELYNVSGLVPSSEFVEDGSFVKLREIAVRYRFGADQLSSLPILGGFTGITFSMIGRNLFTWTDYRGYDPEVGKSTGETGSAALARVEGYQYPNFRTWTFGVELNF